MDAGGASVDSAVGVKTVAVDSTAGDDAVDLGVGGGYKDLASDDDERQERERLYRVGFWRFHPDWLQIVRNAKAFTFVLCLASVVEGAIVSGFLPVILSTLERRYSLSSVESGSIGVLFDVAVVFSVVFVSYFGERGHKPRWLALGMVLQGIACWFFASPHFFFGSYTAGSITKEVEICSAEANVTDDDCSSSNYVAYTIFIVSYFLMGVSASPLFTIGTSFLDDIVRPKFVPLYLGVFYITTVLGPAIGFVLGGSFLTTYVDVGQETRLTPDDPAWVGAWWISYILMGGLSFLISIPFFLCPRQFPDSDLIKAERAKEMAKVLRDKLARTTTLKDEFKAFPDHIKTLLLNPSYVCLCFALGTMFLLVSGLVDFAPKYLESQYNVTPTLSAYTVGAVGVISATIGIISGGVIIFVLKIRGKKLPFMMMVIQAIVIPMMFGFFFSCPTIEIPGVTVSFADGSDTLTNATCLSQCNCVSTRYEPVCGTDGYTYISPCLAGCQFEQIVEASEEILYTECSCLNSTNITATPGVCDDSVCSFLYAFIIIVGIQLVMLYTEFIPIVFTTVRIVAEEQRTLALGFQSVIWRLLGTIPGPLFFGALFDTSCVYWQFDCGERGNCWVYDNSSLALLAFVTGTVALTLALGFYIASWLTYPKHQFYETTKDPLKDLFSKEEDVDGISRQALKDKQHTSQDASATDVNKNGTLPNNEDTEQGSEAQDV